MAGKQCAFSAQKAGKMSLFSEALYGISTLLRTVAEFNGDPFSVRINCEISMGLDSFWMRAQLSISPAKNIVTFKRGNREFSQFPHGRSAYVFIHIVLPLRLTQKRRRFASIFNWTNCWISATHNFISMLLKEASLSAKLAGFQWPIQLKYKYILEI